MSNINKIRSFINKNQKAIAYVLLIAIFAIVIIYGLNYYYAKREEEKQKELEENNITTGNGYTNGINVTMDNIQDEDVKNLQQNTIENTMKVFVNYCNNGDAENAYNLLPKSIIQNLDFTELSGLSESNMSFILLSLGMFFVSA